MVYHFLVKKQQNKFLKMHNIVENSQQVLKVKKTDQLTTQHVSENLEKNQVLGNEGENNYNTEMEEYSNDANFTPEHSGSTKMVKHQPHMVNKIIGNGRFSVQDNKLVSDLNIKISDSKSNYPDATLIEFQNKITEAVRFITYTVEKAAFTPRGNVFTNTSRQYLIQNELGLSVKNWNALDVFHDTQHNEIWEVLPSHLQDFNSKDLQFKTIYSTKSNELPNIKYYSEPIWISDDKTKPILKPVPTFDQDFQRYSKLAVVNKQQFNIFTPVQSQTWPVILKCFDLVGIDTRDTENKNFDEKIEEEMTKYSDEDIKSIRKARISNIDQNRVDDGVDILTVTPRRLSDFAVDRRMNTNLFTQRFDRDINYRSSTSFSDARTLYTTIISTMENYIRQYEEFHKDPIKGSALSFDFNSVQTVTKKIQIVELIDKDRKILQFIDSVNTKDKIIMFYGKKVIITRVPSKVQVKGLLYDTFYRETTRKDREMLIQNIIIKNKKILFALDIKSRAVEINNMTHVLNFDFQRHIEKYVQSVDGTGRARETGEEVSLFTEYEIEHGSDLIKIFEAALQNVPVELIKTVEMIEEIELESDRDDDYWDESLV